jgi:uncharacterized protein involved in exopolysaccharide biosynthesis
VVKETNVEESRMTDGTVALDRADDDEGPTLLGVANLVLRYRRFFAAVLAISILLFVGLHLVQSRSYTSSASFIPQSKSQSSNLAGLAANFGLSLPGGDAAQSPQFYVDLLRSREVLLSVADSALRLKVGTEERIAPVSDWLGIKASSTELRRLKTLEALRTAIDATAAPRTGVVSVNVRAPSAALAYGIASRLLDEVNRFNLKRRQSQAASERVFTEQRVADARAQLRTAEDRLQAFYQANARTEAPLLRLQRDRLERDVGLYQGVYSSLTQALEQSRIDEVRDTPVITIIEPPDVPVLPDSRHLVRWAIVGVIAGLLFAVACVLVRELTRPQRHAGASETEEFEELWSRARAELRRPWRLFSGSR